MIVGSTSGNTVRVRQARPRWIFSYNHLTCISGLQSEVYGWSLREFHRASVVCISFTFFANNWAWCFEYNLVVTKGSPPILRVSVKQESDDQPLVTARYPYNILNFLPNYFCWARYAQCTSNLVNSVPSGLMGNLFQVSLSRFNPLGKCGWVRPIVWFRLPPP